MIVNTTRFGVIEVDDDALISMPEGMIGMSENRSYCLIDHQPESVFKWLQSTHDPDLAFLVIDPSDVVEDYEIVLPDWDVEFLQLRDTGEAVVMATVTIDTEAETVSSNLLAPVVINARTRLGRQVILDSDRYGVKHEICPLRATCAETAIQQGLDRAA
jgi:flagellar assembly factor FliW